MGGALGPHVPEGSGVSPKGPTILVTPQGGVFLTANPFFREFGSDEEGFDVQHRGLPGEGEVRIALPVSGDQRGGDTGTSNGVTGSVEQVTMTPVG